MFSVSYQLLKEISFLEVYAIVEIEPRSVFFLIYAYAVFLKTHPAISIFT